MSKRRPLAVLGAIASIGGGLVVLHGVTSRRWQRAHTAFALLGWVVSSISLAIRLVGGHEDDPKWATSDLDGVSRAGAES